MKTNASCSEGVQQHQSTGKSCAKYIINWCSRTSAEVLDQRLKQERKKKRSVPLCCVLRITTQEEILGDNGETAGRG